MRKLIAFLAVILITGCGPSPRNAQVIRFGNGHAIAMTTSVASSALIKNRLRIAGEYTVGCWEAFNKRRLEPTLIIISENKIDDQGLTNLNGIWRGGAVVEVWIGEKQEMPALFHELCHRSFYLYNHDDLRWPLWDLAGNNCYQQIASSRN